MLERLPRQFEREPLLRVHHLDLTRRHLEEVRVETLHVVEVATADIRRRDRLGHPWNGLELGPPVLGEIGYAVATVDEHVPRGFRGEPGLGEAGRDTHDGDIVIDAAFTLVERGVLVGGEAFIRVALDDPLGQRRDGRVLIDDGRGQQHPRLVLDVGTHRHRVA